LLLGPAGAGTPTRGGRSKRKYMNALGEVPAGAGVGTVPAKQSAFGGYGFRKNAMRIVGFPEFVGILSPSGWVSSDAKSWKPRYTIFRKAPMRFIRSATRPSTPPRVWRGSVL